MKLIVRQDALEKITSLRALEKVYNGIVALEYDFKTNTNTLCPRRKKIHKELIITLDKLLEGASFRTNIKLPECPEDHVFLTFIMRGLAYRINSFFIEKYGPNDHLDPCSLLRIRERLKPFIDPSDNKEAFKKYCISYNFCVIDWESLAMSILEYVANVIVDILEILQGYDVTNPQKFFNEFKVLMPEVGRNLLIILTAGEMDD